MTRVNTAQMPTRSEHIAWCKARALQLLDAGERAAAIASMLSDLTKFEGELYDLLTFQTLALDGMRFCPTDEAARHWIEGFQ